VGRGEISYHHHRFDDVQRCPVGSVSVQAWRPQRGQSPASRRRGGEQEGGNGDSIKRGVASVIGANRWRSTDSPVAQHCFALLSLANKFTLINEKLASQFDLSMSVYNTSVRKRFPAGRCGGFFPGASKR